jgi:hypothetical protein
MMVFGVGASTCETKCEGLAFRRNTEVTDTTVPTGTRNGAANPQAVILNELGRLLHPPLETGAVSPDAVQDDCDLAGDCDLGLLRADTLH